MGVFKGHIHNLPYGFLAFLEVTVDLRFVLMVGKKPPARQHTGNPFATIFHRLVEMSFTVSPSCQVRAYHHPKENHHFVNGGNDFQDLYTVSLSYIINLDDSQSLHRKWLFHQTSMF